MAISGPPAVDRPASDTVAHLVARRVPVASPTIRAGDLRRMLEGASFEFAGAIAICEDARLVGLLRVEDVLAAPEDALAADVMDREPSGALLTDDQEVAAWRAAHHGAPTVAVVDNDGRFVGLIPPHRLLAVLHREHEEDMARLGGFLHDASLARTASQEPVARRLWHRLPWLLLGLGGALFAADIVGAFEAQLRTHVTLAFFLPGVVYLADAVGTQTETLIIRGLSVGVGIRQVVRQEMLTGLAIGVALAAVFYPFALWRWGDSDVALAVSLALLAACSVASLVALALPWVLHRLGRDPAFGSGPMATVVQDLLSILIYFAIAVAIVA